MPIHSKPFESMHTTFNIYESPTSSSIPNIQNLNSRQGGLPDCSIFDQEQRCDERDSIFEHQRAFEARSSTSNHRCRRTANAKNANCFNWSLPSGLDVLIRLPVDVRVQCGQEEFCVFVILSWRNDRVSWNVVVVFKYLSFCYCLLFG